MRVAIPLRGYVVCNLYQAFGKEVMVASRNPLTGLCGLQPWAHRAVGEDYELSQSPYGAMWFATRKAQRGKGRVYMASQSPYGAMWFATLRP